jgi:1-acyl-sn-glycerol-3-phosphate acyltransferase
MIREGLVRLFRGLAGIYFRDVEVVGCPDESTRGRLFAANHVNGLIDPILVLTSAPFPIAPIAKEPLFRVPVLRWLLRAVDAVPVVRKKEDPNASNDAVFDKIAEHFARGGNVLIFPEGVSHSEPQLVQLKTGPSRMLARAKARGTTGLTFQSVALEFDARGTFRSRALVLYGPVRSVDAIEAEGDALARKIQETLRADLADLVVEGRTWPEKLLIARIAQLLAHDSGDRSLHGWSTIGRQVEAARDALGDAGAALHREVDEAVTGYFELLERSGVNEDLVVAGLPRKSGAALRGAILLALSPLAAAGALLYAIPYQLPKLAPRLAKGEGDVVSTYKLGIGLVVYPLWMGGLVTASMLLLPPPVSLGGAAVAIASPFVALAWLDRAERLRAEWAALTGADLQELRRARDRAIAAIERARAHLDARAAE